MSSPPSEALSALRSRRTLTLCNSKTASVESDGKKCLLVVKSAKELAKSGKKSTQNVNKCVKRAHKAIKNQVRPRSPRSLPLGFCS